MKVTVAVTLKAGVLDPQGKAAQHALANLGFEGVQGVRIGKLIEVELEESTDAEARVKQMCEALLANPVIETFEIIKTSE